MKPNDETVTIIGAGPAGCTMACLLAIRGYVVKVFDDDRRPDLLVGESLIPTVIPIMKKLGIEERVREFSMRKPGASFFHGSGTRIHFKFQKGKGNSGSYAYNVPRPEFDDLLRERAVELGVEFIDHHAKVQRSSSLEREVELTEESLIAAGFSNGQHPKVLVDATGRARLLARTLDIDTKNGERNDIAYFAHYKNFTHDEVDPGQIIISVLDYGWSWRIPLKDKLSVGVVIDKEAAKRLGSTAEERLETAIRTEPLLREKGIDAQRVSKVMSYTNYQRIANRGHGKGWVMLGDAYGFVDPMLSPGLFMALESAYMLDRNVFSKGIKHGLNIKGAERYSKELFSWHEAWQELIAYFYDGRILRMYEAGKLLSEGKGSINPSRLMEKHVTKHIQGMVSGVTTRDRYPRSLLSQTCKYLVWDVPEAEYFSVNTGVLKTEELLQFSEKAWA